MLFRSCVFINGHKQPGMYYKQIVQGENAFLFTGDMIVETDDKSNTLILMNCSRGSICVDEINLIIVEI